MIQNLKNKKLSIDSYPTIMLVLALLMLPFSLGLSNVFIILLLLISIYHVVVNKINIFNSFDTLDWLYICLFFLHLISFLWTDNTARFSSILERNLSWIIFPFLLAGKKINNNLFRKLFFFGFLIYALVNELMIMEAFITSKEHIKTVQLYFSRYYQLSNAIRAFDIHYAYISLYNCIAVVFGLGFLNKNTKWYYYLGILVLIFYNFQLGSRIFFIINILLLGYFTFLVFKKSNRSAKFILVMIFITAYFFGKPILVHTYARFSSRITQTFENRERLSDYNRLDRWKLCIEIISENFWIGVSAADAKGDLVDKYNENGLYYSAKQKLNSHNQYLDYFIKFGFLGFLLLVLLICIPIYNAFLYKNYVMLCVILLFGVAFLTENYLSVQRGIVPFCILILLLDNSKHEV